MKNKLFLCLGLLASIATNTSDRTDIFVDRPDLTWEKFEQEFRSQYPDANIPVIKDIADIKKGILVRHAQRLFDLHEFMAANSGMYLDVDKIVLINLDYLTEQKYLSGAMRTVLLHEAGHHMYPEDSRKRNQKKGDQIMSEYEDLRLELGHVNSIATRCAMVVNGCSILRHGPNAKLLCGLFLIEKAHYILESILGSYAKNRAEFTKWRCEEIAADRYAFERASVQDLKAFDETFVSVQALQRLQARLNEEKVLLGEAFELLPRASGWEKYIVDMDMKWYQLKITWRQLMEILRYKSSIIHDIYDPAHPCDRDRSAAIAAELQRRGEK